MKKILITIFLILLYQSSLKAESISSLEIEGMSIGDSALNFFSEKDIIKNSKNYYKDKTFTPVQNDLYPFFKEYDAVDFNFRTGDKKYIIQNLNGILYFDNDIENCYKKMDTITKDIDQSLNYIKKSVKQVFKHRGDVTGKSKFTQTKFDLTDGYVLIICYDYSKEFNNQDHLSVSIDTLEMFEWLMNDAY